MTPPTGPSTPPDPGAARATAWVAHLRAGGTTPWAAWTATTDGPAPRVLPGAQQLELLRRLNEVGPVPGALAERVLAASAAGRGRPDLELVGSRPPSEFGPPPVDPADLPAEELLRVAALLLAEDLAAAPGPGGDTEADDLRRLAADAARRLRRRGAWRRPWRTRYRLVGDPWRADVLRRDLVAQGRPPGGRGALVLVVADDLATMLADLWTDRCFSTGVAVPAWDAWLDSLAGARRIARGADPAAVAARWAQGVGADRVRIVLDERALADLLGVDALAPRPALPAHAVELARLVSGALGLLVTPEPGRRLLREVLLPRLLDEAARTGGPPLGVPPEHHRWVHRRSLRLRDAVLAGDYPVLGQVEDLVSRPRALAARTPAPAAVADERVLALAADLLLGRTAPDRTAPGQAGPDRARGEEQA